MFSYSTRVNGFFERKIEFVTKMTHPHTPLLTSLHLNLTLTSNLYPQKLALTSPTSGGRSVGIVLLKGSGHGV
jgi:hypothetical protein